MLPTIADRLKNAGVRNLKEFGYPDVNADNIMTDQIYSQFFASMLRENLGNGHDEVINRLLEQIPA